MLLSTSRPQQEVPAEYSLIEAGRPSLEGTLSGCQGSAKKMKTLQVRCRYNKHQTH